MLVELAGRPPPTSGISSKKVQMFIEDGKTASEIQQIMKISPSSYFRYKKLIKTNDYHNRSE